MNARYFIEREGGVIVAGAGGRHRRVVEPSLATLLVRQVRAQLRGVLR